MVEERERQGRRGVGWRRKYPLIQQCLSDVDESITKWLSCLGMMKRASVPQTLYFNQAIRENVIWKRGFKVVMKEVSFQQTLFISLINISFQPMVSSCSRHMKLMYVINDYAPCVHQPSIQTLPSTKLLSFHRIPSITFNLLQQPRQTSR